jgi:type I restriction enzyme R subunit
MIVAMSRRIAAELYKAIIEIRPEWHSDDLKKGVIKVVMTSASSDGPEIRTPYDKGSKAFPGRADEGP